MKADPSPAEVMARTGLALGARTLTALALLHDVHHVPSFESHLGLGALLVVGDGSVRLQDDGARDVCGGGERRSVPAQKHPISAKLQDSLRQNPPAAL